MLKLHYTTEFKRRLKRAKKRGKEISKLNEIVDLLQNEKPLHPKHRNHKLSGNYNNSWECHIEPDWLLIYDKDNEKITLLTTGTHSDLFE